MNGGIQKRIANQKDGFQKTDVSNNKLKFSFEFFDHTDEDVCPPEFPSDYTQNLMRRLRALSKWSVEKFQKNYDATIRNHMHEWEKTDRAGFGKLKGEFRDYDGWQFCLENPSYGRVHGIMHSDTFFVIWLDFHHRVYPNENYANKRQGA